jgi:hypothetical protein
LQQQHLVLFRPLCPDTRSSTCLAKQAHRLLVTIVWLEMAPPSLLCLSFWHLPAVISGHHQDAAAAADDDGGCVLYMWHLLSGHFQIAGC